MTSSYSSLTSNLVIPQIQYEDLGLTLKVKPHIEGPDQVALALDLKLDSLAGSTLNNTPVLANRQYAGALSLHRNESALAASLLSKQETKTITGVPGLSDIPGLGGTTNRDVTTDSTELVILITPISLGRHTAKPPGRCFCWNHTDGWTLTESMSALSIMRKSAQPSGSIGLPVRDTTKSVRNKRGGNFVRLC